MNTVFLCLQGSCIKYALSVLIYSQLPFLLSGGNSLTQITTWIKRIARIQINGFFTSALLLGCVWQQMGHVKDDGMQINLIYVPLITP